MAEEKAQPPGDPGQDDERTSRDDESVAQGEPAGQDDERAAQDDEPAARDEEGVAQDDDEGADDDDETASRDDDDESTSRDDDETPPRRKWHRRQASAALIGVLTLILGFAIAVQVHANSTGDTLSGLSEEDLIGILDDQNARADRLRQEIASLQDSLRRLRNSGNQALAARHQAQQEAETLGVLLGTLPATGPGISVAITDPRQALSGEDLLDVVEELRGAGAEAIQFGPVRVSTGTAFTGPGGSVEVDHTSVSAPYQVLAIGDPKTLDTALNIPGGVASTVRAAGGTLTVDERSSVTIRATRTLPQQKYATPTK